MRLTTPLLLAATNLAVAQKCYSSDGQQLDSRYQPCFPQASNSACCMLNGTQGANQQNDICMDSGICQSTSGWYSGFLYINGCTDKTGTADGCAKHCNSFGTEYSWSVLQCEPGKFCCRAASDTKNCCGTNKTMISTSHIGTPLLPGSSSVANTTFNYTSNAPTTPSNSSSSNTTCTLSDSSCPTDHSAFVGGTVGGVLGAALIGSLAALLLAMRSRQKYKSNLIATSAALTTAEMNAADQKAHLHGQYPGTHFSQASTQYTYGQFYGKTMESSAVELPEYGHGVNELEDLNSSRSELTAEQRRPVQNNTAKR